MTAEAKIEYYKQVAIKKARLLDSEKGKSIICPNVNCGYTGEPVATPKGKLWIGILLCLFYLLPGILYFIFTNGYRYKCPDCGAQIAVDNKIF